MLTIARGEFKNFIEATNDYSGEPYNEPDHIFYKDPNWYPIPRKKKRRPIGKMPPEPPPPQTMIYNKETTTKDSDCKQAISQLSQRLQNLEKIVGGSQQ
jgi:hypothetical protein